MDKERQEQYSSSRWYSILSNARYQSHSWRRLQTKLNPNKATGPDMGLSPVNESKCNSNFQEGKNIKTATTGPSLTRMHLL